MAWKYHLIRHNSTAPTYFRIRSSGQRGHGLGRGTALLRGGRDIRRIAGVIMVRWQAEARFVVLARVKGGRGACEVVAETPGPGGRGPAALRATATGHRRLRRRGFLSVLVSHIAAKRAGE